MIKGIPEDELKMEVETILADLDLSEKIDAVTINLSGGQKRRLSVGKPKLLVFHV